MSEDCLNLNLYLPTKPAPPGGFPIMLFFYGGSWKEGAASFLLYDADSDVTMMEDVVFITANYRLGAFGFLASEDLRSGDPGNSTGNYGFQDQRLAMQWARANAPYFNGNPDKL
ncbi:Ces5a [Symbiodinium sp. KB8]|nr:Ces5a [Symbiodinium sp. KB8]